MISGIIQTDNGFAVKNFETGKVEYLIGNISFGSYMSAAGTCCGTFYPTSYYHYLEQAKDLGEEPDTDIWENMIYADDPHGVYDGETKAYRNVSSMDRGAATEEEIAYVEALDATYKSLLAMVVKE